MTFDATLRTAHALASDTPQQSLTFIAICGRGCCPHLKVVWSSGGDGVDQSLQRLFIDVALLQKKNKTHKRKSLLLAVTEYCKLSFAQEW